MHFRIIGLFAASSLISVVAQAASSSWIVDTKASTVTFAVRATGHSFTATVPVWTLAATVPVGASEPDTALFTARIADLVTGNAGRDEQMRRWFEQDRFATIEFKLTGITSGTAGRIARGELTIHGVPKAVEIPITTVRQDGILTVSGEITIDHREHGLEKIRKFGLLTVAPEVKVAFIVVGKLP